MKKLLPVLVAIAALSASACSKAPDCTAETLAKKAGEVTAALQEAVTKDPAKAAELSAKVQEVVTKYQGATAASEACKAYDELLTTLKG